MVATGDEGSACRRTKSSGMELCIAQPSVGDPIQRWRRNDAAKRSRHAVTLVIGHDEQDVRRALGRHHARRPPRCGILGILLDDASEFRRRWRDLFAVDGGCGTRSASGARDLLRGCGCGSCQAQHSEKRCTAKGALFNPPHGFSPISQLSEGRRAAFSAKVRDNTSRRPNAPLEESER